MLKKILQAHKFTVIFGLFTIIMLLVLPALYPPMISKDYALVADKPFYSDTQGYININTAIMQELCVLKGIGEVKAKAIIDYREQNGKFQNSQELLNVEGISPRLYESIKTYITID